MFLQPISHDSDKLGMDLVLMFLVVLRQSVCEQTSSPGANYNSATRTRFSLSNSTSMTACFWLRCRRKVSRTYGMSSKITDSDCDARARRKHNRG